MRAKLKVLGTQTVCASPAADTGSRGLYIKRCDEVHSLAGLLTQCVFHGASENLRKILYSLGNIKTATKLDQW